MGLLSGLAKVTGKAIGGAAKKVGKVVAEHVVIDAVISGKAARVGEKIADKAEDIAFAVGSRLPSSSKGTNKKKSKSNEKQQKENKAEKKQSDAAKKQYELKISPKVLYLKDNKANKTVTFKTKEDDAEKSYIGYLDNKKIAEIEIGTDIGKLKHHWFQTRRTNERYIYINDEEIGVLDREISRKDRWNLYPTSACCIIDDYEINYDGEAGFVKITRDEKTKKFNFIEDKGKVFNYDAKQFSDALLIALLIIATIDSTRIDEWNINSSHINFEPF